MKMLLQTDLRSYKIKFFPKKLFVQKLFVQKLFVFGLTTFSLLASFAQLAAADAVSTQETYQAIVKGKGVILPAAGHLKGINTRVDGIIRKVNFKRGDTVKAGDSLVEIYDRDFALKYKRAVASLEGMQKGYTSLSETIAKEAAAQRKIFERRIAMNRFNIEQISHRIEVYKDDLETKRNLLTEGLISVSAVNDAEQKVVAARIERESVKATLADLEFNLAKGYRADELGAKLGLIATTTEDNQLLEIQNQNYKVDSPYNGEIVDLFVSDGQVVRKGDYLLLIEEEEPDHSKAPPKIFAYFNVEDGKKISVGQIATIKILSLDPAKYGTIKGKVTFVSKYSTPSEVMQKLVYNRELVSYLTENKPVMTVVIEPAADPKTKKWIWPQNTPPAQKISSGTVCSLTIDTNQ